MQLKIQNLSHLPRLLASSVVCWMPCLLIVLKVCIGFNFNCVYCLIEKMSNRSKFSVERMNLNGGEPKLPDDKIERKRKERGKYS